MNDKGKVVSSSCSLIYVLGGYVLYFFPAITENQAMPSMKSN